MAVAERVGAATVSGEPGRSVTIRIASVAAGGDGVGRLDDGRVAFVPRTAPGDVVEASIEHDRGRWVRARVDRIIEEGSVRRAAPCPIYDRCGGCQLQHLTYVAQLEAKAAVVRDALGRIGGLEVDAPRVEASPDEFGYRNRLTFTLRRLRGGRVVAGFHALGRPGRVVDVEACLLPEAPLQRAWGELRAAWGPGASRLPAGGELRLTLRAGAGGAVLLAVEGGEARWSGAPELLAAAPSLVATWHRPSGDAAAWRLVAGDGDLDDVWFGERVPLGPGSFVQVNRQAAELLHRSVLGEVGGARGRRVIDAYAGHAAYGRRLARHGASVTAIESDPDAVRAARHDAPPGLEVLEGRVEDHLASTLPADLVLVNPPRTGLHETVPEVLAAAPPERVVYVSCDPATLARDLARFGDAWAVRRVASFDLFPQTAHVETVVTLDRRDPKP